MQKLLVVDENSTIQRVIKLAFKDEDFRVITVPRGRDPYELIEDDPPDIILADTGREVAAFLKTRARLSHIPVVLLKGAFDGAADGPDEALGCADVLMKPLQPQTMIDRVKRLLRERAPSRVRQTPAPEARTTVRSQTDSPDTPAAPIDVPAPQQNPHKIDPGLELGQYFDRLSAAFSQTSRAGSSAMPDAGWLYPPRSAPAVPQPKPAEKSPDFASGATDDLVEQVTQRVLERLSDRVVRSTATELVSRLSKWLIVDQLEKSKT